VASSVFSSAERLRLRLLGEAGGQGATCPEEEGLDGGLREAELLGDLLVGEALPLAEEQRAPLLLGHLAERLGQPDQLVRVRLARGEDVLDRIEIARRLDAAAPRGGALAGQADVLRDLVQPRRLELRVDAALVAAEGVQERRLDRVLRLLPVPELVEAVREDLAGIALVEVPRRIRFGRGAARGHL
jgi:hypothetical protein